MLFYHIQAISHATPQLKNLPAKIREMNSNIHTAESGLDDVSRLVPLSNDLISELKSQADVLNQLQKTLKNNMDSLRNQIQVARDTANLVGGGVLWWFDDGHFSQLVGGFLWGLMNVCDVLRFVVMFCSVLWFQVILGFCFLCFLSRFYYTWSLGYPRSHPMLSRFH